MTARMVATVSMAFLQDFPFLVCVELSYVLSRGSLARLPVFEDTDSAVFTGNSMKME